jgi:hypothetical protein
MVNLNNVNGTLLPPTITGPIFQKANETSAIMNLARRVPLSVAAATAIPVNMDVPTAGWVAEGGAKPVSASSVGIKTMTGKKVAVIVPVSEEVVMSNAAGLYDQLSQDLPTAISRAFDYAAIHGLDLKTGAAGPFADYLAKTPNTVNLGTTADADGGIVTDLWEGVENVVENSYDFTGFAADPRLRPQLGKSTDSTGRGFFVNNSMNANAGVNSATLLDYPVYFNSGVSGKYRRQGDAVQLVTLVGTPTGGTFTISAGGSTTSALAYNISAANLQIALRLLSPAGNWSAATATGTAPGPFTITQVGGGVPLSVDQTSLTGGTAAASQATITQSPAMDSGLRAVGGDFGQCAYGVGMDITIRVSRDANYSTDGGTTWHSAFQENLVLLLAEAYFGFVVGDPLAFNTYTS